MDHQTRPLHYALILYASSKKNHKKHGAGVACQHQFEEKF
jgi:hypothetical protein